MMRIPMTSGVRKLAAGLLSLVLVLVVLLSAYCIAVESGHDCEGEECAVCECIRQCKSALHPICNGAVMLLAAIIPAICLLLRARIEVCGILRDTPISRKVRLND